MELIQTVPEFNLYEDFWNIFTESQNQPPSYTALGSDIRSSLISEGCEIFGSVYNSILSTGVIVEEGAVIRNSIIMQDCIIRRNSLVEKSILDEGTTVGEGARIGVGENIPNKQKPNVYCSGITVIGERSTIPDKVTIGKNCVISGATTYEDYDQGRLESGDSLIMEVMEQ
jgi:glucose-1-phosphate adenylyltransferase